VSVRSERARIERLLWRAGFGGRPRDIDRLARMGLEGAVDELLRPRGAPFEGRPARVEGAPLARSTPTGTTCCGGSTGRCAPGTRWSSG
jgi:hypothetical protein